MPPLPIALLQSSGRPGDVAHNLRLLDEAAGRAASAGARLLVTPELFLTGYAVGSALPRLAETADGPSAGRVAATAAHHGVAVALGYPERDGRALYNAVSLTGPDGTRLAGYRKTHLYGEFETAAFTPGDRAVVQAELDGTRLGLLVCYDVEFPETVRAHALAGTELLLVPTALMRPYEIVPRTLLPARAWENQLHIAYANRTGPEGEFDFAGLSCLAAPDGTVPARAGRGEELLFAEADPETLRRSRAANPYLRDRRPELYGPLAARG
ncbi:carbon-nitrogen hydrolase family protein [Streptomyces zingiberis]|uniref:Carbon-nitrogen hydrolase family protein n=1 Tax=Streptomyces zingiberis TaxID=2053010 RepID=A0ABX1BZI7_9ACTN|nr:carbon-nitrogen hydrolase family protein [Streptomyces zingiberis]NJQ03090.1 carbon-nitrogen hydrolase family protein [Streptomyces zingiberis]